MLASPSILSWLKKKESFRANAYRLSGETGYTIGYGNRFYENGQPVGANDTITMARAEQLFNNIVAQFSAQVASLVTSNINQNQFDALVSYAYNRGITKFANSTLLQMVNADPNNPQIYNQFMIEWGSNNYYREALIARRKEEADLYFAVPGYMIGGGIVSFLVLLFAARLFYKNVIQ